MATLKQQELAKNIIANLHATEPLNKQELVVSSGYSDISADRHATEIIESKGVQRELRKLGFDSESAQKVVAEILQFGESDRDKLKAAELIFKVTGDFAPEKHLVVTKKIISIDE